MTEVLQVTSDGGVTVLTMDRVERRNAVDRALADALDAAFADVERDPSCRVVVLTGAGGFFSAGTDLREPESPATPDGGEYGFVRRRRTVPVIAAVEGVALGGGLEMVLACDLVVVASDARLGLPEVKRGVVANCGALFRAPERLPAVVAAEMLLTGDPVGAARAAELGLVNQVVEPGQALEAALALAARIAVNSPASVRATTRAMLDARDDRERAVWPLTERAAAEVVASPDRAEGIAAFFEKRSPRWSDPV